MRAKGAEQGDGSGSSINSSPGLQEMLVASFGVGCRRLVIGHTPQDQINVDVVTVRRKKKKKDAVKGGVVLLGEGGQRGSWLEISTEQPEGRSRRCGGRWGAVVEASAEYQYEDDEDEDEDEDESSISISSSSSKYEVWRIDTGASSGIAGGPVEMLEIRTRTGDRSSDDDARQVTVLLESPKDRARRKLRSGEVTGAVGGIGKLIGDDTADDKEGELPEDGLWRLPAADRLTPRFPFA